jgi:hypothetical protein
MLGTRVWTLHLATRPLPQGIRSGQLATVCFVIWFIGRAGGREFAEVDYDGCWQTEIGMEWACRMASALVNQWWCLNIDVILGLLVCM